MEELIYSKEFLVPAVLCGFAMIGTGLIWCGRHLIEIEILKKQQEEMEKKRPGIKGENNYKKPSGLDGPTLPGMRKKD